MYARVSRQAKQYQISHFLSLCFRLASLLQDLQISSRSFLITRTLSTTSNTMVLLRSRYSTRAFDPKKWLLDLGSRAANARISHPVFNEILEEYRKLADIDQHHLQQAMPYGAIRQSLSLHSMIEEKHQPSAIFQHIVDSSSLEILSVLVETYLFSLMRSDNLNAVVSLVHILFHSNAEHYRFSNQFWSLLTSKCVSLGHHGAASLVYHEIINPYVNFLEQGSGSEENEHILFLLLPTTIEMLAIIFAQNGNHIAVEGLRQYFKRFYSNFGHRDVYQTLYIAKVESLSTAGLFSEALSAYMALTIKYQGHIGPRNPKDLSHSLKYASHINFKKRKKNISQNLSAQNVAENLPQDSVGMFSPDIKFNDYTITGGPYWAIFEGVISVEDLPKFKQLLGEKINGLLARYGSVVDRLLAFILKNHFSISKFVIACLCDAGHVSEAIAVVSRLPTLFPKVGVAAYLSQNDLRRIFKALERELKKKDLNKCNELHLQVIASYELCHRLVRDSIMSRACIQSFLQCYFSSPLANMDEINRIVESFKSCEEGDIILSADAYQKALSCGLSSLNTCSRISERRQHI